PDPKDGRGKRVSMNAAGRRVVPAVIEQLQPAFFALISEIDLHQIEALLPTLEAVRTVLQTPVAVVQ
ncbi:MAG: hypothetical protein AAF499_09625, partial [Pseudomonadota bacterium]